jgi:hypothetical protein
MMDDMVRGDEFAEIDTLEAEIDWMMAAGEPVTVVTSPVLAGSPSRAAGVSHLHRRRHRDGDRRPRLC